MKNTIAPHVETAIALPRITAKTIRNAFMGVTVRRGLKRGQHILLQDGRPWSRLLVMPEDTKLNCIADEPPSPDASQSGKEAAVRFVSGLD